MDLQPSAQIEVLVDEDSVAAPNNGRSPRAYLRSVFREDRFFLVLSVFIGVFSGLAVVCLQLSMEPYDLYLLGMGRHAVTVANADGSDFGGAGDCRAGDSFLPADAWEWGESNPKRLCISTTVTFRSGLRSASSLRRRSPSARGTRSDRKIRHCKSGRAWPRPWGGRCGCRRETACGSSLRWAQRRDWPGRSMLRSQQCCL